MLESTYTNLGPTGTDVYVKQSVTVNLRSVSDLESRSKTLMGLHDHIADLKAQYDANKTLTFPGCMCLQSPMFVLGGIPLILSQGRMRPPSCRLTSERWKLSKILSLASLAPLPKNPASHVRPWHSVATASAVPGAPRQWWSKTSWRSYFLRSSLAQPHGYQFESFFMATHSSFDFLGYIGSGWGQSWNPRRRVPKILLRLLRKRSLPRRAQVNRDREMTLRKKSQLRHPLRQGWARGNPLSPRLRQSQAAKESELFFFSSTYCHLEIPEYNCCNVLYCSVSLSLRVATAAFWLYLLHRSCSPIRGPIVKIIFGENLQVTMCPCSSLDRVAAWEKWENLIKSEFLALVVPIYIYISISPHRELPTASSLWVPDHFPNAGPKTSASKAPGNKPGPAARALAHAASQGVGVRENGSHHFGLRIFGKNNG